MKQPNFPLAPSIRFADSSLPEGAAMYKLPLHIIDAILKEPTSQAFPCEGKVAVRRTDG